MSKHPKQTLGASTSTSPTHRNSDSWNWTQNRCTGNGHGRLGPRSILCQHLQEVVAALLDLGVDFREASHCDGDDFGGAA
eukprot:CAMPEP_0196729314 /NCGR_PEP_ID=MMETSP1091-20130531/9746_1 /TAXON_ID=302021 /ORGANISM="Rhodomonas sp., Strain CCMP768" /LENGTH=79 /DNA_ID=CAMNT_0042072189 /DNA_START=104 /DNA_END=343 /DNA_ORIENTATION=-